MVTSCKLISGCPLQFGTGHVCAFASRNSGELVKTIPLEELKSKVAEEVLKS